MLLAINMQLWESISYTPRNNDRFFKSQKQGLSQIPTISLPNYDAYMPFQWPSLLHKAQQLMRTNVLLLEAPSVLHFNQLKGGGFQSTSLMIGALGGCTETLNFFRIVKSVIEAW
jgi:hypothetical protein